MILHMYSSDELFPRSQEGYFGVYFRVAKQRVK